MTSTVRTLPTYEKKSSRKRCLFLFHIKWGRWTYSLKQHFDILVLIYISFFFISACCSSDVGTATQTSTKTSAALTSSSKTPKMRTFPAPAPAEPAKGPFRGGPAYRAWAPPEKQWEKQEAKKKSNETRIEVQDEWDEEGNLTRTTIKKIITPDWKIKTETTVEEIPAEEAAKYRN